MSAKRLASSALLFGLLWVAASLVKAATPVEFVLPNGLKLIVKSDHRAPLAAVEIWYRVGSRNEPLGLTGISHVVEHLMFRGTSRVGPGEFSKKIAALGGQLNAFTSNDYTGYYSLLPAKHIAQVLQLEADRLQHLLLDNTAIKEEMQVVMEERRLRTEDQPQAMLYERFMAIAHPVIAYRQPIVGWMHDLTQLTPADIRQWYHAWYVPNNAIIVVVGDVQPQQVKKWVMRYFATMASSPTPRVNSQIDPAFGERHLTVAHPAKLPYLLMGYSVPSLKTASDPAEAYALMVAAQALSGGRSARLIKQLVRTQGLAVAVDADYSPYRHQDTLFLLSAVPAPKKTVNALEQALCQEIARLKQQPLADKTLARIKAQAIAEQVYKKDQLLAQANLIGALETVGLSWRDDEAYLARLSAVTAQQVQAVAKRYFIPSRLTVAVLDPLPMKHSYQRSKS